MQRYLVQGSAIQDPMGPYVAWTDVQSMNEELGSFVETLLTQVTEGGLSKTQAMGALNSFIRLSMA